MKVEGLLGDPLLQIGLGILANNTGHRGAFAPAFGQGVQQGLNNVNQYKQMQQMNDLRQQQIDSQSFMRNAQVENWKAQQDELTRKRQAIEGLKQRNPHLADLIDIDPESAIKAAYPQTSKADPYYTPIATENGLGSFDNRSGTFTPLNISGKPIIKSTDSPIVRGAVKGAEAQAAANWKPNTDIDGQISTDAQVAQMARGFNTPYPLTWNGQPMGAEGTTLTDRQEGINSPADIRVGNPAKPNGIRVPTKAEQAAETQRLKDEAEYNSPENTRKRQQAYVFKTTNGKNMLNTIDDIINRVGSTTAGFGGSILKSIPSSDAYDLNSDIETVKANFGFDRLQAMRDMSPTGGALGQVAVQELSALQASVANLDTNQSPDQLKKNLKKARTHYENWLNTIENEQQASGGNIMPPTERMPNVFDTMPKPNQYKGKVLRDDVTGKRYQSDGLKWKEIK